MASASSGEEENYWPGYVDALTTMLMVLTFVMMVLGIVVFTLSQSVSKNVVAAVAQAVNIDTSTLDSRTPDALRQAVIDALKAKLAQPPIQPPPASAGDVSAVEPSPRTANPFPSPAPTTSLPTFASGAATLPAGPMPTPDQPAADQDIKLASLPPTDEFAQTNGQRDKTIQSQTPPTTEPRQKAASLSETGDGLKIIFKNGSVQLDQPGAAALQNYTRQFESSSFVVRASAFVATAGATDARRRAYYRAMLVRERMIQTGLTAGRIAVEVRDNEAPETQDLVQVFARNKSAP